MAEAQGRRRRCDLHNGLYVERVRGPVFERTEIGRAKINIRRSLQVQVYNMLFYDMNIYVLWFTRVFAHGVGCCVVASRRAGGRAETRLLDGRACEWASALPWRPHL